MDPTVFVLFLALTALVIWNPGAAAKLLAVAVGAVVALVAGVVALGHRFGPSNRRPPEPELGPPPADGFAPGAGEWWERKREREERARYQSAYDAGRADAQRERVDRLLGIAGDVASRNRRSSRRRTRR